MYGTQVSRDPEVQQKDQGSKARMKAYADTKRSTKPHDRHIGDSFHMKQRRSNKASSPIETVPHTIRDIKDPVVTRNLEAGLKYLSMLELNLNKHLNRSYELH